MVVYLFRGVKLALAPFGGPDAVISLSLTQAFLLSLVANIKL